jgi:hypothetical protein
MDLWDIPGASPSEVMDAQIYGLAELTRTEAGESQVYTSSERFLTYAGIAVQVAYPGPTTYFHLRRLTGVGDVAVAERERIAKLHGDDPLRGGLRAPARVERADPEGPIAHGRSHGRPGEQGGEAHGARRRPGPS